MYFVPIVTFCEVGIDLLVATGAPAGHGHRFAEEQAHAWALVIPPDGWTSDDTTRLVAVFE